MKLKGIAALALSLAVLAGCSNNGNVDIDLTGGTNSSNNGGGAEPINTADTGSLSGEDNIQQGSDSETEAPQPEFQEVTNGNLTYFLNNHWYGIQLYAGGYNQDLYIKSVNAFAEDLDGTAQVYSMIAPTNGDFYCPESYGNVEIPFYMNSFEEIYVTDVRFFDLNAIDFIKQNGITDVLFTMCTFSAAGQNCEGIEMMRTGAGHLINW